MPRPSSDHPVLRAAARWRERCLRDDGSVFTEKPLWTAENVGYLVQYFAENLDEGEGGFLKKLEQQLSPAPGSAKTARCRDALGHVRRSDSPRDACGNEASADPHGVGMVG